MKTLTRLAFLLGLIVMMSSCSVTNRSVCGVYIFIDKHNPEFSEVVHLKPDSTFNFEYSSNFVPYPRLHGNWNLKNRRVYLKAANISVLPGAMGGDTLGIKNWTYVALNNKLKRLMRNGGFRKLKKLKGNFKTIKLNYETF